MKSQNVNSNLSDENCPRYRLFQKTDLARFSGLLETIKPEIAGLRSPELYDAICFDAVSNRNIIVIVAEEKATLIGFNITIIGRRRFFRYFLFKHPFLALRIARVRLMKLWIGLTGKKPVDLLPCREAAPYIVKTDSGRSWKDPSPDIAKILFTAVRDGHRGRRVSVGIGEYLLDILENRGVRRVDTLVEPQNLPAIRLTHGLGFRIERRGEWLLGSIDMRMREDDRRNPKKTCR